MAIEIKEFEIFTKGFYDVIDITPKLLNMLSGKNNCLVVVESSCPNSSICIINKSVNISNILNILDENIIQNNSRDINSANELSNELKQIILSRNCTVSYSNNKLNIDKNELITFINNNQTALNTKIKVTIVN